MGTLSGLVSAYRGGEGGREFAGILSPKYTRFLFLPIQTLDIFLCLRFVMWSVCFFSHPFFISSLYSKLLFWDCQGIFSGLDRVSSFASVFVTTLTLVIGT